jgi:hypothetical protein
MATFKHHSYFPKLRAQQQFRFPFVCFSCRKSFKFPAIQGARVCPQCRKPLEMLSRKFSAPKSKDLEQWQKVQYLVEHGFRFYPVRQSHQGGLLVRYPATLKEAKVFVETFKSQAEKSAA